MARSGTVPDTLIPVDAEIDSTFGEPVVLKPMKGAGYRAGVADLARVEVVARGIYDQGYGAIMATGGGIMHQQATCDTTLSIRHEPIDQCQLRKSDRVYFPDRGETYEVTFIYPDPGGRPDVHLVRILEEE
jgi:hypothetical protein